MRIISAWQTFNMMRVFAILNIISWINVQCTEGPLEGRGCVPWLAYKQRNMRIASSATTRGEGVRHHSIPLHSVTGMFKASYYRQKYL